MAGTKKTTADAVETKTVAAAPAADKKEALKTSRTKTAKTAAKTTKKAETKAEKAEETLKETKAPAKRAAKTVKSAVYVQFAGKEFSEKDLVDAAKKAYEALGNKASGIKTLDVYVKPEESAAYYVVNGEGSDQYKIEL